MQKEQIKKECLRWCDICRVIDDPFMPEFRMLNRGDIWETMSDLIASAWAEYNGYHHISDEDMVRKLRGYVKVMKSYDKSLGNGVSLISRAKKYLHDENEKHDV